MGNDDATRGGAGHGRRYELWLYFGNWTGEPGMGSPEQVARDYGVEFERLQGGAGVVAVWHGASETDAVYEAWETVRMGGVERVEVREKGRRARGDVDARGRAGRRGIRHAVGSGVVTGKRLRP